MLSHATAQRVSGAHELIATVMILEVSFPLGYIELDDPCLVVSNFPILKIIVVVARASWLS